MTTLGINDPFPDLELPDHSGAVRRISRFTQPGQLDERLGFSDGYPLVVVFNRGFFCPRDQEQLRQLVNFQDELAVNFCKLVTVSADPPIVQAAFRAGLGASWPFLSDEPRAAIKALDILDETEGEYAYRAQPYTFVLRSDLSIFKVYNGWFFVGRPTVEELRHDLRTVMETRRDYAYEAYTDPEVTRVRIPQQAWAMGAPRLGENGLPVARGVVHTFDLAAGVGFIKSGLDRDVFFHFTAIPGEGYRTLRPGTAVVFEVVTTVFGPSARNVQLVQG